MFFFQGQRENLHKEKLIFRKQFSLENKKKEQLNKNLGLIINASFLFFKASLNISCFHFRIERKINMLGFNSYFNINYFEKIEITIMMHRISVFSCLTMGIK